MTRRAKGGTTKTKHKQLAQLAGKTKHRIRTENGKLCQLVYHVGNWQRGGRKQQQVKGGKQKNEFKMPNCTNFNRHEKRVTNCTRIARKYSRAQGVASSSQSQYSLVGRRQLSGKRRFQIS